MGGVKPDPRLELLEESKRQNEIAHRIFRPTGLPARFSAPARIKAQTKRAGGATADRNTGEEQPSSSGRYVYNPGATVLTLPKNASQSAWARALRTTRRGNTMLVGTYKHDKGVDFDRSVTTNDRDEATRGAIASNQHSIYDRLSDDEIVLCGVGGYKCQHHGGKA